MRGQMSERNGEEREAANPDPVVAHHDNATFRQIWREVVRATQNQVGPLPAAEARRRSPAQRFRWQPC
jgi:hypothetical protein